MTETTADSSFRIGAVARMTGISPDALRVWERRYQTLAPRRSPAGTRLYSAQDVERLRLIKRLIDAGQAIGTLAGLDFRELQTRVAQLEQADGFPSTSGPLRLLLAGPTLPTRLMAAASAEDPALLTVVGSLEGLSAAEHTQLQADVLIVECATLDEHSLSRLRQAQRMSGARRLLVVYGFAPREALAALDSNDVVLLRFPVSWESVRHHCVPEQRVERARRRWQKNEMEQVVSTGIPARRFDDAQLARAGMISTNIKCECPHHLADLIISLARFERYSAECENRNAEDAQLHSYLHGTTAKARALMEGALAQLLEMEGLDVGEPAR
jgi:hypothetical protein